MAGFQTNCQCSDIYMLTSDLRWTQSRQMIVRTAFHIKLCTSVILHSESPTCQKQWAKHIFEWRGTLDRTFLKNTWIIWISSVEILLARGQMLHQSKWRIRTWILVLEWVLTGWKLLLQFEVFCLSIFYSVKSCCISVCLMIMWCEREKAKAIKLKYTRWCYHAFENGPLHLHLLMYLH